MLLLMSLIPYARFTSQEEVVLTYRQLSHAKEGGNGAYYLFCSRLLPPPPYST